MGSGSMLGEGIMAALSQEANARGVFFFFITLKPRVE